MNVPDFIISPGKPISDEFLKRKITTFQQAMDFVKALAYARNPDKDKLITVFSDNCGTCSTKHALLKKLADENNFKDIKLVTGIFKMNAENSPLVKNTLLQYQLAYIPEAHNYLRYKGKMLDCTKVVWNSEAIEKTVMEEIEILPEQINGFKIKFHKKFLSNWLLQQQDQRYNLDEIWAIRGSGSKPVDQI